MLDDFKNEYDAVWFVISLNHLILTGQQWLLQPLSTSSSIWKELTMDYITNLLMSLRKSMICVVVNRLRKGGHFIPLKSPFTFLTVVDAFSHEIVGLHGCLCSIITDCVPIFLSFLCGKVSSEYRVLSDWRVLLVILRLMSSQRLSIGSYNIFLICFFMDMLQDWMWFLHLIELWCDTSQHLSTSVTSFDVWSLTSSINLLWWQPSGRRSSVFNYVSVWSNSKRSKDESFNNSRVYESYGRQMDKGMIICWGQSFNKAQEVLIEFTSSTMIEQVQMLFLSSIQGSKQN